MASIATLTPDRGDRPAFMNFCSHQLTRMAGDDTLIIKICDPPVSNSFDLVKRFKAGVQIAESRGIDKVVVIESDDFYPENYLSLINLDDYDFFGWGSTYYYNIRNRAWQRTYHQDTHSSLFCTAFRLSALNGFQWPPDDYVWLDIALWKFARHNRRFFLSPDEPPCIGIKHNVGKVAGKAHKFELPNKDPYLKWLGSKVDDEAFQFYSNLKF